jgi:CRP-like cAMP-binding protein
VLDRDGGVLRTIPAPDALFLNGLVEVARGIVLAVDSLDGRIWRLHVESGEVSVRREDPLLTTDPGAAGRSPGANGLKVRDGMLYVSNSSRRALYRVSLDGSEVAGALGLFAETGSIDDFAFIADESIAAASHGAAVIGIAPDGTVSTPLGRTVFWLFGGRRLHRTRSRGTAFPKGQEGHGKLGRRSDNLCPQAPRAGACRTAAVRGRVRRRRPGRDDGCLRGSAEAFFYILEGESAAWDEVTGQRYGNATLGPTQFTGELRFLSGGTAQLTNRAVTPLTAIWVARPAMLQAVADLPEMSDIVVTVFAARRRRLIESGQAGSTLIGPETDRTVRSIEAFAAQNRIPLTPPT